MMQPRRRMRDFTAWAMTHYRDYLERNEGRGGFCDEWVTGLIKDATAEPELSGANTALEELIAKAGRSLWGDDPLPPQLELFAVGGLDVSQSYTVPDPNVPGNHRRIIATWATPRHATLDAIVTQVKADEALRAAQRKREAAAAFLAQADGNPDLRLWDIRDIPLRKAS